MLDTKLEIQTGDIAVAQHRGARLHMEDRYSIVRAPGRGVFAAVFDGHNGSAVADILVGHLSDEFFRALAQSNDPAASFQRAFARLDALTADHDSGAAAAAVYLTPDSITVANAGDCAVYIAGGSFRQLTRKHRVDDLAERRRVAAAGAFIRDPYFIHEGRGLMITRGFGDCALRAAGLIAEPDIGAWPLSPADRHIILLTDGIADYVSPRDVGEGGTIASRLISRAQENASADNMTAVVIPLNPHARPVHHPAAMP